MRRIRFKTLRGFGPGRFSPPLQKPSQRIPERIKLAEQRASMSGCLQQDLRAAKAVVAAQRHAQAVAGGGCPLVIARLALLSSLAALDAKQGKARLITLGVDTQALGYEAALRTEDFPLMVSVGQRGDLEIHLPERPPLMVHPHEAVLIREALASLDPHSSTADGPSPGPFSSSDGSGTHA